MKKIITSVLIAVMLMTSCITLVSCKNDSTDFTVGVCQLARHDALDAATEGFKAGLTEKLAEAGKTVTIDVQVAGDTPYCPTIVNTFKAKRVDLIMGNATPALKAASAATNSIPVLGTSVTDYNDTFGGKIPANVSGTSDAVAFDEQAEMMISTLGLVAGDKVGVIYCTGETNSKIQYEAVKALFESEGIIATAYTFAESSQLDAVAKKAASESKAIYIPSDNVVSLPTNETIVSNACNAKNVPIYTSYGGGICYASLAIDYYQLGYETGVMAAQILLGEAKVSDIEVKTIAPTKVYNEELCEQLGIAIPEN